MQLLGHNIFCQEAYNLLNFLIISLFRITEFLQHLLFSSTMDSYSNLIMFCKYFLPYRTRDKFLKFQIETQYLNYKNRQNIF